MDPRTFTADWRDRVVYSAPTPQPVLLADEEELRVVLVGLEPRAAVADHAERGAVYTALEGEGRFLLDGEELPFAAGAVVVVPRGSRRGIRATTRLAFIGVRVGGPMPPAEG